MGLDVTELRPFTPTDVARLAARAGCSKTEIEALRALPAEGPPAIRNPVVRLVTDALRFYFEFHLEWEGYYGADLHDPFAVAAALDRTLVTTKPVFVDIEAGSGLAHGMAVTDWRRRTGRAPNVDVAVDGETERFTEDLIDRIGGLAAVLA
jgi:purine nucleosidase